MHNAAMNICVQVFVWMYLFISLGYVPRVGVAGSYAISVFSILRNYQTVFQSGCTILHSHQQTVRIQFSHIFTNTCFFVCLFDYSHPSGYKVVPHRDFDLHFLNDVEHLFMCLLAILMSSLEKCLFKSFVHFLFICLFKIFIYLFIHLLICLFGCVRS